VPKRRLHISDFRPQVRPADDPGDLRLEEAEYAEDVSVVDMPGALRGRFGETDITGRTGVEVLAFSDDAQKMYFEDGGTYYVMTSLFSTVDTAGSASSSGTPNTCVARQSSARFGHAGQKAEWVGTIDHGQFSGSSPSGKVVEDARLIKPYDSSNPAVTIKSTTRGSAVDCSKDEAAFEGPKRVYYALSLVYDGFQEGPIQYLTAENIPTQSNGSDCWKSVDVEIEADTSYLPDRVTDIVLYAFTAPWNNSIETVEDAETFASFQKVRQIPITNSDYDSGAWSNPSGTKWQYTVTDEHGWSTTYPKRTGVTQQLDHMDVQFGIAAEAGPFTFYAKASVDGVENDKSRVYRSKAGRPDMIDWSFDSVSLDFEPVALQGYRGRVIALGEDALCTWSDRTESFICFFHNGDGGTPPEGWALYLPQTFWTEKLPRPHWRALTFGKNGIPKTSGQSGENTIVSIGGQMVDLFGATINSLRKEWTWVSKEIGGGQPGPERVFYHLDLVGDAINSVEYREDRGTWNDATPSRTSTGSGRDRYEVNSSPSPPWAGVTRFQLFLQDIGHDAQTGDVKEVRAATLTVRERAQTS